VLENSILEVDTRLALEVLLVHNWLGQKYLQAVDGIIGLRHSAKRLGKND
jgi:hypothetical protein